MSIDRAQTLRNAEKLIRQGKIDAGIAEYVRLVEDSPHDWNAKNVLGDLYARAGQTEKAIAQRGVPKGDRKCAAIAAASIVAKVTRDREMLDLHGRDPRYGFDRHKGYATADHLEAVARFGYSEVHRRSFRPPTLFDTID